MEAEEDVLTLLTAPAKIDRDRGVGLLQKTLRDGGEDAVKRYESAIENWLRAKDDPWETKHGALMATKALLSSPVGASGSPVRCSEEFARFAEDSAMALLEHGESRVRLAAGEVIGELCRRNGVEIYINIKERLLEGVRGNLERKPLTEAELQEQLGAEKLVEKLASSQPERKRRNSTDAEQIFHDTAGWKSLETWMKCLQSAINGCGRNFDPYIDPDLLELIFQTLNHTNRFVRETGYYVCGALVGCNAHHEGESSVNPDENAVYRHGNEFALQLAKGLADNWSQVRLASSVAAREFLMGLPAGEAREKFFPMLLPPLCLNRYYVAEGVRIYNQKTWAMLTEGQGRELVEQYIKDVVEFYIHQSEADNHAVREAACACIAELGSKINKDVVRPFVSDLLDALLICFRDESWPVRDASCVACGNFISCFPKECHFTMEILYELFFENLQDNIPSVRQGAAIALVNVVKAYGMEAMDTVVEKVKEGLEGVADQPATSEKYGGLDKSPATYGVVKRLRDNDMELHTDQQMYSCGSLAPKMHRGTREGGCMDHKFRRPAEPWELGEGCVNVLAELSKLPEATRVVCKLLPLLAKAASHRHYANHIHFLETVCKVLIVIAKGIGKRMFKAHLEMFLDDIFYSLSCDNPLTSTAASQCICEISSFLGPNILRGRIEQYNPRYLEQLPMEQIAQSARPV